MSDVKTAQKELADLEAELTAATRAFEAEPTVANAKAVGEAERQRNEVRDALARVSAVQQAAQRDAKREALEAELAECEEKLRPEAIRDRLEPLLKREAGARTELYQVELGLDEARNELLSACSRSAQIRRELGDHGSAALNGRRMDGVRATLNIERQTFINQRLREHARLPPGTHRDDMRLAALQRVEIQ
jgi:hypothetical protein